MRLSNIWALSLTSLSPDVAPLSVWSDPRLSRFPLHTHHLVTWPLKPGKIKRKKKFFEVLSLWCRESICFVHRYNDLLLQLCCKKSMFYFILNSLRLFYIFLAGPYASFRGAVFQDGASPSCQCTLRIMCTDILAPNKEGKVAKRHVIAFRL